VALSVLIGLALLTTSTFGAESIGKVDGILDGDTFVVLHINRAERSRLNGIDCPEKDQAYGKRAKQSAILDSDNYGYVA